jgi:hypothetical protein
MNYALIIYECSDLENIGLSNLKKIQRGSVKVERNEMLCFVDTIDWSSILHKDYSESYSIEVNIFILHIFLKLN